MDFRKRKRLAIVFLTALITISMLFAGCGGTNNTQQTEATAAATQAAAQETTQAATVAEAGAEAEAEAGSDDQASADAQTTAAATTAATTAAAADSPGEETKELITITTALRTVANQEFEMGYSYEDTVWTRMYEEELGIKVEYLFNEDAGNYEQRATLAINSGEIPDVMRVYDPQIATMYNGGMLCDLTDIFESLASDVTKQEIQRNMDGTYMAGAYMNGRLMMLPYEADSARDWEWPLFIRKDWLDNVGMDVPKTIDEFMAVCDAFVNGDPTKTGRKDTYALAVAGMDNLLTDWAGLMPFFSAFDAQPGWWFSGQLFYEIENGSVIWSGAKPGVKDALTVLQEMYKNNYLAADFGTMDSGERIVEDICNSKAGMLLGDYWVQWWPLNMLVEEEPEASWIVTSMPTVTGAPVRQERYQPASSWTVVSSACKHPEAIMQMLNLYCEIWFGMGGNDPRKIGINPPPGKRDAGMGSQCATVLFNSPSLFEIEYNSITNAINTGNTSGLTEVQAQTYDEFMLYKENPLENAVHWPAYFTNNPEPGYMNYFIFEEMAPNHPYINNAYMGILTNLMADRYPIYQAMAMEKITRIIYGQDSVDSWDNFVSEWGTIGNNDIIAEIESLR